MFPKTAVDNFSPMDEYTHIRVQEIGQQIFYKPIQRRVLLAEFKEPYRYMYTYKCWSFPREYVSGVGSG